MPSLGSILRDIARNIDVNVTIGGGTTTPVPPAPPAPIRKLTLTQRIDEALRMPVGFNRDAKLQQVVNEALAQGNHAVALRAAQGERPGFSRDADLNRVVDAALVAGDLLTAKTAVVGLSTDVVRGEAAMNVAESAMGRGDLTTAREMLNGVNPYYRPATFDGTAKKLTQAFVARGDVAQGYAVATQIWDMGVKSDAMYTVAMQAAQQRDIRTARQAIAEISDPRAKQKAQHALRAILPPPAPVRPSNPGITINIDF